MTAPKVSVILTSYNKPDMVRRAITSVREQTYRDFELLVLDDHSGRETLTAIDETLQLEVRANTLFYIAEVTEEDRRKLTRYAVLANLGLRMAVGKYVTYLCDDDFYYPRRLEAMVEVLDRGEAKVVYGTQELRQLLPDGTHRITGHRLADRILDDAFDRVDHSSVMHVRQIGLDVGGWDEGPEHWHHADAVFWRKLNRAGYRFYPIPEVLDVHVYHAASVNAGR